MLRVLKYKRRLTPAALAAAAAAAVIAGVPAPSAVAAAGPAVFAFPVITQPPAQVAGLPAGVRQVAASVGGNYGLALLADGTVSAWGISLSANSDGELGDGTTVNHTSPAPVHNLSGITQVAAGGEHGLAIGTGGSVWAWGGNRSGQLGDGTTADHLTPVQVPGLTGVTQVSGGGTHSMALRSDGTVWTWGSNTNGELGDGTTTAHGSPEKVPGLTGITQVSAGFLGSFALRADGTLFAWGDNEFGQLGDGTTISRSTPEPVPGLTEVVRVSAGFLHTLALVGSGHSVWAWGDNSGTEIGDGTSVNRLSPVQLSLSGVAQVDAGVFESSAIRPDGTLLAWGDQITSPAQVSSLTGVTQVSLGDALDLIMGQSAFTTVPDLTGESRAVAAQNLQNAGLMLGTVGTVPDNSCNNIGTVLSQNPAAGTSLRLGSAVSITIGGRPRNPCP